MQNPLLALVSPPLQFRADLQPVFKPQPGRLFLVPAPSVNGSVNDDWDAFVINTERRVDDLHRLQAKKMEPEASRVAGVTEFAQVELYLKQQDFTAVQAWVEAFGAQAVNHRGENLLHLAMRQNNDEALRWVVATQPLEKMLEAKDNQGQTPLALAHGQQNWLAAETLLKAGAVPEQDPHLLLFLLQKAPAHHITLLEEHGWKPYKNVASSDMEASVVSSDVNTPSIRSRLEAAVLATGDQEFALQIRQDWRRQAQQTTKRPRLS